MLNNPMTASEQSAYEYKHAPNSMGYYLTKSDIKDKTVLDFGCGWGGSLWLKYQGAGQVIGVDINENLLKQARLYCFNGIMFTSDIS
jgi:2-polyprenyl-3-methyl-5-hydroxy-6-metoxy-1,4-benzoquinol methylase